MKWLWVGCVGLTLGWLTATASAEDFQWRPAKPRTAAPAPAAVAPAAPAPGAATAPTAASPARATLGQPVTLLAPTPLSLAATDVPVLPPPPPTPSTVIHDPQVQRVSLSQPAAPRPIIRGLNPETRPTMLPPVSLSQPSGSSRDGVVWTHYSGSDEQGPRPMPAGPTPGGSETSTAVTPLPPPTILGASPVPAAGPVSAAGPVPAGGPVPMAGPSAGPAPACCEGEGCCTECADCVCSDEASAVWDPSSDPGHSMYGSAEYLLWAFRPMNVPVLATTGPATTGGVLGQPGTQVLAGGRSEDLSPFSGGRFTLGYWLDDCEKCGIEGTFFFLAERSRSFSTNSSETPVIARPFFNTVTGRETVQLTAFPGAAQGGFTTSASSALWGAGANVRHELCCGCNYRIDLLTGFRYVDLLEDVQAREDFTTSPNFGSFFPNNPAAAAFNNTRFQVFDRFQTRNQFYGANVGFDAVVHRGRWSLDMKAQVALGETHQVVNITGTEILTRGGSMQQFQGGLLALPSNIGHHARDRFSVVPEGTLTIGYNVTDNVKIFAGYNFLFMSNVVRPGDQIDTRIDARQIPNFTRISPAEGQGTPPPGPQHPVFMFHETSFWAQGLTAGMEFTF